MKLKGLKKVCGETKSLKGFYGPIHLQLNVDRSTGEIWTDLHSDQNDWTRYHDENVINCGNIYTPMKMSEIEAMVNMALATKGRFTI